MSTLAETKSGTPKAGPEPEDGRRRFLAVLGSLAGASVAALAAVPVVSFLVAPIFEKRPRRWRKVGAIHSFGVGDTVLVSFADSRSEPWAGVTAKTGAWLRRVSDGRFEAFAINCTHLGCPVRWEAGAQLFMCPCHGGVYHADGTVAAGPPPEPLRRYQVRVRHGQVEVETGPMPIT